jgi:hypothetical protein
VHAPFVRDLTGFDCPWRYLAELVDDLRVTEIAFGTGYLALGRAPDYEARSRQKKTNSATPWSWCDR